MDKNLYWDQQFSALRLSGEGCKRFLNGQTTVNILKKKEGEIFLACWLSASGQVRSLLEIRLEETGAIVIAINGNFDLLYKSFENAIFPSDKVSIDKNIFIRRLQLISAKPDESHRRITWLEIDQAIPDYLNSYLKASSIEIESWRLKNYLPISSGEINGEYNPFELGLESLVSLDKGCYLGQELIAKLSRSSLLRRKIMAWRSDSILANGVILKNSKEDKLLGDKVGQITSSVPLKNSIGSFGLAVVNNKYLSNNICFDDNLQEIRLFDSVVSFEGWY